MSTLKNGDKLVYFSGSDGYFEFLKDPSLMVKIIVGGMTFFMGFPEHTSIGVWKCHGLNKEQAYSVMKMIGDLCGLKSSLINEDDYFQKITCLFNNKKRSNLRYTDLYRKNARFCFVSSATREHFELSRITIPQWQNFLRDILSFGFCDSENEDREIIANWNCHGLNKEQADNIGKMIADIFELRLSKFTDIEMRDDILFIFTKKQKKGEQHDTR